ncbi:MAG: PEP-CTERM sorting domain-containing protein, partial [Thermoguttaceae bacterium]|nr:PEP-CTERM sorting domain-containing protein [Thermoguttaceae bacterium]
DIDVINGVVLSPGNSVGTMYETGDLTLKSGASLLMELGGTDASENDLLIVTGNIILEEGAFVDLVLADGSSLGPNSTFTAILSGTNSPDLADNFIDNYVRSSIFTDLQYAPLSNGLYAITGRIDPNAVPEPSTWALLILGAAGLMYWRKRQ